MKNKEIILVDKEIIDDNTALKILEESENTDKNIGLDMKNVVSINSKIFIDSLLADKFKLFNLKNELLTYLSLILKDGFLKSYVNKFDFIENKRELIRRKFIVISSY